MSKEKLRLAEAREKKTPWKKWGPYLSERQWGTVREDYSKNGDAWNFFTHDQARSRAYRWGEDGIAGISDDHQGLCFSSALWNGKDSILKERLFGLTNSEGNHGEDVKEYYFYLDSTPTHSYMKYLYKYPQAAFPYADLVETNRKRNRNDMEYELLDTGVFNEDRYFDVFVEYAKAGEEGILVKITAIGIYGNSKMEAMYPLYTVDADGQKLDAAQHRYSLRFAPGQMPPVNAFWSLTMYELPSSLLSANPLNRYLLNSPMLPQFKKDADGGLTLLIQNESPGADKEANWLPAPKGPFFMAMRLYWPKAEAMEGNWTAPPLKRVK